MAKDETWLDQVNWNAEGLVPVIAREPETGAVLNLAWMNREALKLTLEEGRAVYWSRSRGRLWRKGEESGHVQHVREVRLDCDQDTILLSVEQAGGIACHTGRHNCFYLKLEPGTREWRIADPVIVDPDAIYSSGKLTD